MRETTLDKLVTKVSSSLKISNLDIQARYPVFGAQGFIGNYHEYQTDKESIAIIKDGAGVGRVQLIPAFSSVIGTLQLLVPKSNVDVNYLYYLLKHFDLGRSFNGATIPHIYFKDYKGRQLIEKNFNEQKAISKQLMQIDKLIESKEKELDYLDTLIKSRFIEMFKTIDLSLQKEEWVELEKLSKIYTGTTPSTNDSTNWDGDVLWITPAEMNKDTFYVYDTARKITEKGRKSKSLVLMPVDTVLLSTRAPIGKVGIVGKSMTCNQGFKNFKCDDRINPIFLYILFKNNTEYLNSLGSGTTFLEVSKSKIGKMKIPVPEIKLQNEFSSFVKLIDKSKFVIQQQIKALQELLEKKMGEYFGGNL